MDCAAEEAEIRHALSGVDGIRGLQFLLGRRTLAIDADAPAVGAAVAAIRRVGFDPEPLPRADAAAGPPAGEASPAGWPDRRLLRLGAALLLAIVAELIDFFAPATLGWHAAGLAVAASAIALAGFEVYRKGLAALRHGRLNINALMTVAVTGAILIGQWPEAAMVMALYAIAEAIEARAVDRARNAIQGLLALAPDEASVYGPDESWTTVPVTEVPIGATVRVRPGERVPLDGHVTSGSTTIDQAPITGESLPVDKAVGDPVYAGTINATALFEMQVDAAASDSTLARIIHAVEQAQSTRAPIQRFVDRFAAVYTPAVFAIAAAVALLGPVFAGWSGYQSVYKALVLLVIACPCALVISTPVTIVSGLAAAARRGILIKGGIHLEQARRLKAIAMDKTGTITEGAPRLVDWTALDEGRPRAGVGAVAAALAAQSDHPVSRAIAVALLPDPVGEPMVLPTVRSLTALPGRGIRAEIDGTTWYLGNRRLMEEIGHGTPAAEAALAALAGHEQAGRTVTLLADGTGVVALFAVADTIKPTSREAIAMLQALGVSSIMLSGDNQATADAIAREAGITAARGNLLPDDKLAAIRALQQSHGPTAMTGDGINDSPALAQADIGIAMGAAGTDIAIEAADVVVMNDDLRRIGETIVLSRATWAILWQNITLALGIKAIFLVLAVFGEATMWMAVFADMGASLLVVLNGLRLLRYPAFGAVARSVGDPVAPLQ